MVRRSGVMVWGGDGEETLSEGGGEGGDLLSIIGRGDWDLNGGPAGFLSSAILRCCQTEAAVVPGRDVLPSRFATEKKGDRRREEGLQR